MKLLVGWSCPFTELSQPPGTDAENVGRSRLSTEAAPSMLIRTAELFSPMGLPYARLLLPETLFIYSIYSDHNDPNKLGTLVFMIWTRLRKGSLLQKTNS